MSDESQERVPPDPLYPEGIPWGIAFSQALMVMSGDFQKIPDAPDMDLFRLGVAGFVVGNVVIAAGAALGLLLMNLTGLELELFFLPVAWGVIIFAVGVYRLGVLAFPFLKTRSGLGSTARMIYLLLALAVIGSPILYLMWYIGLFGNDAFQ